MSYNKAIKTIATLIGLEWRMIKNQAYELALEKVVDNITNTSFGEGFKTTQIKTMAILLKQPFSKKDRKEEQVLVNLLRSWIDLLNSNSEKLTVKKIQKFNYLLGVKTQKLCHFGQFRYMPVRITKLPLFHSFITIPFSRKKIKAEINELLFETENNPLEQALTVFTRLITKQYFPDCNKRTAQFSANYILIQHNIGVLCFPEKDGLKELNYQIKGLFMQTISEDSFKKYVQQNLIIFTQ